jgi:hypothetical protein
VIRWLEGNPVGMVLGAICGGLLLIVLALAIAWSLPPKSGDISPTDEGGDMALDVPHLKPGEPIERFAVITERPVFNEDRQPFIASDIDEEGEEGAGEGAEEVVVGAPEVTLTGVVITPELRMVTLSPKGNEESLVAFEGKPLEGDYGTWHVTRIEPRRVTLQSGEGEELQLDLQIHDAVIEEPPKPVIKKAEDTAEAEDRSADEGRPLSRAEEIRQRIAERREELRRAAEENQQQAENSRPADYRSAIRSLMAGKQNQAQDEEDEQ